MQFISSDTSVWIDFATIHKAELPFRLSYKYLMSKDAVEDELLSPPGLGSELISYGLIPVEITIDEFFLAQLYGKIYFRLSTYDRIALAIAKKRNIILLTGDGALRKAAAQEGVAILGTLGILDQLWKDGKVTAEELKTFKDFLYPPNQIAIRIQLSQARQQELLQTD